MKLFYSFAIVAAFAILSACTNETTVDIIEQSKTIETGNHVSIEEALKAGDALYSRLYGETRAGRSVSDIEFFKNGTRSENNSTEGYYIVNYGDEEGFCVLSADKRLEPVFAISNEGSLHLKDTLDNLLSLSGKNKKLILLHNLFRC